MGTCSYVLATCSEIDHLERHFQENRPLTAKKALYFFDILPVPNKMFTES